MRIVFFFFPVLNETGLFVCQELGVFQTLSVLGYLGFRQISCQEGTRIWPGELNSMADSSSGKTGFFLIIPNANYRLHCCLSHFCQESTLLLRELKEHAVKLQMTKLQNKLISYYLIFIFSVKFYFYSAKSPQPKVMSSLCQYRTGLCHTLYNIIYTDSTISPWASPQRRHTRFSILEGTLLMMSSGSSLFQLDSSEQTVCSTNWRCQVWKTVFVDLLHVRISAALILSILRVICVL